MPAKDLKDYNKKYYSRNTEERKAQIVERQKKIKLEIQNYKLHHGCVQCGYKTSARALTFHHTKDDKEHGIARMVSQGRSLESILEEAKKCVVMCSNCHAEHHEKIFDLAHISKT